MEQPSSERSSWCVFAAVTVIVIIMAAIHWSLTHPFGIHWDEALYFDQVGFDVQRLRTGMLLRLGGRILITNGGRPPAYRLLALPVLGLFGFHTTLARLVSLACFGLSSWFIYLATRLIGSQVAGAFGVLVFALSPEVVSSSIFFGTDAPLYLATSAMLYYLFASWSDKSAQSRNWIGLGLAIGLGLLSKASFAAIVFPVLAYWIVVSRLSHFGIPSLTSQRKAGVLALLVAAPWWVLNLKSSLEYTQYARGFVRNSLGPPSLLTWMRWLNTVLQGMLGHGVSILLGLVLFACLVRVFVRKETVFDSMQRLALGACACAGAPLLLAQLSGTNHLLRHVSPAMIPMAITVGVLADNTGWTHSIAFVIASGILFCGQLLMIVWPVLFPNNQPVDLGFVNTALPWRVMVRFDQWDWSPIRNLSYACGVGSPNISYLGGGREFDPSQIQYPWVAHAPSTRQDTLDFPGVKWLWRYEDGPINWQKVMDSIGQSDMVITAPAYSGEGNDELDNQYNAEFARRLAQDPRFRGPIRFKMGRFQPIDIWVFMRKNLACPPDQGGQTDNNFLFHHPLSGLGIAPLVKPGR